MDLTPRSSTLTTPEDHSWLGSKHGLGSTQTILLDGTASATVYTNGVVKSGTVLAKNTSTGRYVPYVPSGSNGTGTAAGILYTTVVVTAKDASGTVHDTPAAILLHGQVITSKLPIASGSNGGADATAKSALSQILFR